MKQEKGVCVGFADGKEVIRSRSINRVIKILIDKYPHSEVTLASIPSGDKVFIL